MPSVSQRDVLRFRLRSQLIETAIGRGAAGQHTGPLETVRHLFAMQAQDFAQALWAIGLRTSGCRRSDLLAAMERGAIVRSSPLRGTLFFVAAEDLRWMLRLTTARTLAGAARRLRQLGLDEPTLARARGIAETVLVKTSRDGASLNRDAFLGELSQRGISTEGQRGYHIIWYLAQHGVVCWGPPSGTQQALVLVDEWIPPEPAIERDELLRRFVLRYFTGHGPATLRDLAWWSKLTMADAGVGLALARDDLEELTSDGTSYWMIAGQADAAASAHTRLHALPGFDEFLLGYQDRSLALAAEHADRIVPGGNGIFLPTIVIGGTVAGTWRRSGSGERQIIEPHPFQPLSQLNSASFEREVRRYREFVTS